MNLKEITEKASDLKGSIIAIAGVLGLSFVLHTWMSKHFVTTEHFDNTVENSITTKMNNQFLVLKKSINETEYNVLGSQIASMKHKSKFEMSPMELDYVTKTLRKHCVLGVKLGYMLEDTNCQEVVDKKLN